MGRTHFEAEADTDSAEQMRAFVAFIARLREDFRKKGFELRDPEGCSEEYRIVPISRPP
jgi:hypothetical protein